MKAIIMAGGEGTRLRPLSLGRPKPLVPLLGRPLLGYTLELLKKHGITEVATTLRYMPESIIERYGDGSALGMSISHRVESVPLGTAGGVKACADFYKHDGEVLVTSGDAACDFDLGALIQRHRDTGADVSMALYSCSEPTPYGGVLVSRDGRVEQFIEKPRWERVVTDLVNTGIYVISPRVMELVPENTPFDFARDLFPKLLELGLDLRAFPMPGYWCDIGSPQAFLRCSMDALDGKLRLAHGVTEVEPGIWCDAKLPPDVTLRAPCLISKGAAINQGAVIERSVIGGGSRVGGGAFITGSVSDAARIGAGCIIRGAVLSGGSVVPPLERVTPGSIVSPRESGSVPVSASYAPAPDETPKRKPMHIKKLFPCADRARLMRELSLTLAEAGADFTDGLTLRTGSGVVRISPVPDSSALAVEASAYKEETSAELAEEYTRLVENASNKL